jgi:hypothetical protein
MRFQRPPLQRQTSEPVLAVGGMTWDLSNLCSTQNESDLFPPNRQLVDRIPPDNRYQRRREHSLYPSKEDLGRSLPADIDTSDVFYRSRSRPPSRGNRQRTHSLPCGAKELDQLKPSIPDYYRLDSKTTTSTRSIILPTTNNSSTHVDQTKYDREKYDRYSSQRLSPQKQDDSRWEHGGSPPCEVPQDPPPSPEFISDCSSGASSQSSSRRSVDRRRKPVQVEVYPGEFLRLRGAKETVEAIERGHSKSVFCYTCGLGLRCVADCDLVICPDCRSMSPVPRRPASLFEDAECKDEGTSYRYRRGSLPQFNPLWTDDDESFHSPKQKSNIRSRNGSIVESTGGVGLGLRVDN